MLTSRFLETEGPDAQTRDKHCSSSRLGRRASGTPPPAASPVTYRSSRQTSGVRLTGELVCRNLDEVRLVAEYLPAHIRLTRAEPGCLAFNVTPTTNPLIWRVEEHFEDETVFRTHQERGASSEWGQMTAEIERRYSITGLSQ
ncbi:putative quinol monooxygenase [Subtercola endophyticus]|uniref:putative quinol monooxygenase n=1 Tax=Subtercola endophyticus TaxID=2895559 RepID=UPI0036F4112C